MVASPAGWTLTRFFRKESNAVLATLASFDDKRFAKDICVFDTAINFFSVIRAKILIFAFSFKVLMARSTKKANITHTIFRNKVKTVKTVPLSPALSLGFDVFCSRLVSTVSAAIFTVSWGAGMADNFCLT